MSILCVNVLAQNQYSGKVLSENDKPVAYVNIGVIGKNVGTVSNPNGNFKIHLPDSLESDSLRFSMIGFHSQTFSIKEFKEKYATKKAIIWLKNKTFYLTEVEILSRSLMEKILGNRTESENMTGGFATNSLGSEVATRIKIKRKPTYVEEFNFNITQNKYDSVFFRVNIYEVSENGTPGKNLLSENIYHTVTSESQKVSIDLTHYNLTMNEDFFISLEWLRDLGVEDETGLYFSCSLFGNSLFHRKTSQGTWENEAPLSVGFNVKVRH